jgi:hypothetical protein
MILLHVNCAHGVDGRYGEGGTIGFLGHLNAQDTAAMINDAIQTEARQQMVRNPCTEPISILLRVSRTGVPAVQRSFPDAVLVYDEHHAEHAVDAHGAVHCDLSRGRAQGCVDGLPSAERHCAHPYRLSFDTSN